MIELLCDMSDLPADYMYMQGVSSQ